MPEVAEPRRLQGTRSLKEITANSTDTFRAYLAGRRGKPAIRIAFQFVVNQTDPFV